MQSDDTSTLAYQEVNDRTHLLFSRADKIHDKMNIRLSLNVNHKMRQ